MSDGVRRTMAFECTKCKRVHRKEEKAEACCRCSRCKKKIHGLSAWDRRCGRCELPLRIRRQRETVKRAQQSLSAHEAQLQSLIAKANP